MKPLVITAISLSMIVSAEARKKEGQDGGAPPPQGQPQNPAQEKQKQKEADKAARDSKRKAVQEVMEAKDKNHDGSLSKEEYLAGEANQEDAGKKFDEFNKNKDRFLSKGELIALLGL